MSVNYLVVTQTKEHGNIADSFLDKDLAFQSFRDAQEDLFSDGSDGDKVIIFCTTYPDFQDFTENPEAAGLNIKVETMHEFTYAEIVAMEAELNY